MYGLIPEDWGAYAAPWVAALAAPLDCLKALKLRRMTVTDANVAALVRARGHMLQELRLDKCSGFSTDALRLGAAFSQGGGGGDAAFSQGGGSLSLLHSQSQISQASLDENLLSPRHPSPARDQSGGWSDMGSSSVHGRYPCVCVAGLAKSIGYPTEDKETPSFQGVGTMLNTEGDADH
ncbi:hypothetical protein QYE76_035838 [Lolium multiflorum]|uniref:Transport inhibitor response 1 domain-containing protein n=1 Tax=Lolium multiflorum TaxID=4521 RepID=A0AAD8QZX5_LOLMU|nr:hypothetical protein QYE76_035836 [Lolium multiflorum]KAK1612165.1 hypothetical protein QYE76_035838 [Lolium multiflorum]